MQRQNIKLGMGGILGHQLMGMLVVTYRVHMMEAFNESIILATCQNKCSKHPPLSKAQSKGYNKFEK